VDERRVGKRKMGARGSPMGCSDVDAQKSVRGWWRELWGEDEVACRSPPKINRVSCCSTVRISMV